MTALLEKLVTGSADAESAGVVDSSFEVLRRRALRVLMQHGFPHRKTENWKYMPLSLLEKRMFARQRGEVVWPDPPELPFDCALIHIHDGELDPSRCRLPAGVTLIGLVAGDIDIEDLDDEGPGDAFAWLNLARFVQGWRIRIDQSQTHPLVLNTTTSEGFEAVVHPRLRLELAPGVSARLIEINTVGGSGLINTVLDIELETGARLDHVIRRRAGYTAMIERTRVEVRDNGDYRVAALDGGGRLSRQDLMVELCGPEARAEIRGVAVLAGRSLTDWHTSIRHQVGPSQSAEDFRIVADDQAVGVFNGKIRILPGADHSHADMNTGNMLLSENARINTKPELEIDAEEVTASHGATIGQLDDTARFYLRSRGLSDAEALALLKYGFAAAVFDPLPAEDVKAWLTDQLKELL